MRAAPVLLGVRPPLHPVGVPGFAVIDVPYSMANAVHHVLAQMVASMPGAGATEILVRAAPSLLVVRPAEVPVREALVAVVAEAWLAWLLVNVMVDHMTARRSRHRYMHDPGLRLAIHGHMVIDHLRWLCMQRASPAKVHAAVFLLLLSPHVHPIVVASVAVESIVARHWWCCVVRSNWNRIPEEEPPQKQACGRCTSESAKAEIAGVITGPGAGRHQHSYPCDSKSHSKR